MTKTKYNTTYEDDNMSESSDMSGENNNASNVDDMSDRSCIRHKCDDRINNEGIFDSSGISEEDEDGKKRRYVCQLRQIEPGQ